MSYIERIKKSQKEWPKELDRSDLIEKMDFKIKNVSLDSYKNLSHEARKQLHLSAFEENKDWIQNKIKEYHAAWIAVVDGIIIAFSDRIDDYPSDDQISEICQETKKFPFIFVNDAILAIEERGLGWSETKYENDTYPTLGIIIFNSNKTNSKSMTVDFDTGALGVFVDFDLLLSAGIIEETFFDIPRVSSHLNQQYEYVFKSVILKIKDFPLDNNSEVKKIIACIKNWKGSPFVHINPNRTGLGGRSIPNALKILITLDFKNRKTIVEPPDASNNYS